MPSPFDAFSFDGAVPTTVSNDDILRVLTSTNPQNTGYVNNNRNQQVQGGTQAGIERVNANTQQSGVIAFKDAKGQAVLTNVARDASGNEQPLLDKTPVQQGAHIIAKPDISNDLMSVLSKLRTTTDPAAANALYDNFQQSAIAQRTQIEQDAFKFAENKLGIQQLQKNLELSRQADKSDPMWYPGIGDSAITQKALAELNTARRMADDEAKNFLNQNGTYRTLLSTEKSAAEEYKRIQTFADRKEMAEFQKTMSAEIRAGERQDAIETKLLDIYDGFSNEQLARIAVLNAGDLAGLQGITDDRERKLKTARIIMARSKDKNWQAAISAPTSRDLLSLALNGNGIARKLVVSEEAASMNMPVDQVDALLTGLERRLADPKLVADVFKNRPMEPKERKRMEQEMNAILASRDPNKAMQITQNRVALLMEDTENAKTNRFLSDTASWGSIDPLLIAATDKAKKTTGNSNIQNTLTAYIGDSTGAERLLKAQEFEKLMLNAAAKHTNSVFGMPRTAEAQRLITTMVVDQGWWKKAVNIDPTAATKGRLGMQASLVDYLGRGVNTLVDKVAN